mmetsp:Transcript_3115/g.9523  ORF Transcript_3115/g.9523 Transcript_3115/m.9523 type:complete len:252 (-) Transcript_3115:354-1109(-)
MAVLQHLQLRGGLQRLRLAHLRLLPSLRLLLHQGPRLLLCRGQLLCEVFALLLCGLQRNPPLRALGRHLLAQLRSLPASGPTFAASLAGLVTPQLRLLFELQEAVGLKEQGGSALGERLRTLGEAHAPVAEAAAPSRRRGPGGARPAWARWWQLLLPFGASLAGGARRGHLGLHGGLRGRLLRNGAALLPRLASDALMYLWRGWLWWRLWWRRGQLWSGPFRTLRLRLRLRRQRLRQQLRRGLRGRPGLGT